MQEARTETGGWHNPRRLERKAASRDKRGTARDREAGREVDVVGGGGGDRAVLPPPTAALSARANGVITSLRETFGFIRGTDGVSRFFLPSGLQKTQGVTFESLRVGMQVEFVHIDHPRGPRAIEVLIRSY